MWQGDCPGPESMDRGLPQSAPVGKVKFTLTPEHRTSHEDWTGASGSGQNGVSALHLLLLRITAKNPGQKAKPTNYQKTLKGGGRKMDG